MKRNQFPNSLIFDWHKKSIDIQNKIIQKIPFKKVGKKYLFDFEDYKFRVILLSEEKKPNPAKFQVFLYENNNPIKLIESIVLFNPKRKRKNGSD